MVTFRHQITDGSLVDATIFRQNKTSCYPCMAYMLNVWLPFLHCRLAAISYALYMGLDARKPDFGGKFAKNKDADQPAHSRSLISACVIRVLESTISKLATSEISFFRLVSVAEQAGLNLTLSETPKTDFVATRPICTSSCS